MCDQISTLVINLSFICAIMINVSLNDVETYQTQIECPNCQNNTDVCIPMGTTKVDYASEPNYPNKCKFCGCDI